MKKYLIHSSAMLLITLLLSGFGYSQSLTVEQVSSDSTALRFIREENYDAKKAPQWKFFYLTTGKEWQSYFNFSQQEVSELSSSLSPKRWFKEDLNEDGKEDLVVSGYIAKRPGDWATATFKILVYLSKPGKGYVGYNLLTDEADKYPAYVSQLHIDDKNYLKLNEWAVESDRRNQPFTSDTVYYSPYWETYLNYHHQGLRQAEIKGVSYKVMEDREGSYHEVNIDLESTKKTNMEVITKNAQDKEPDINRVRLAPALWTRMDTLIRSSYVTGRTKGDTTVVHHDPLSDLLPVYLTVHYKDGHSETVQDYGMGANYSQMTIYSCMENIIQNVFAQLQRRMELLNGVSDALGGFSY